MSSNNIKYIFWLTIPTLLIILLLFEFIIFRYIIPATEWPFVYYDAENKLLRYDQNLKRDGVFTKGSLANLKANFHINNYGWNSPIDYYPAHNNKPLIAIIGDSYIEALQVNPQDNIAAKLREKMGDKYEIYSFGFSGAALSHYLQIARYVKRYFNPEVLVFNVVHNDFYESLCKVYYQEGRLCLKCENSQITEAPVKPYVPNNMRRLMAKSAIVRYFWWNIDIFSIIERFKSREKNYNANIDILEADRSRNDTTIAVNYVIKKITHENPYKKLIFMMDAPRQDIYGGNINNSNVIWMNKLLETTCSRNGLAFLDLTSTFAEDFQAHHTRFEFPNDNHWNQYGHKVVAESLYKKLKEMGL